MPCEHDLERLANGGKCPLCAAPVISDDDILEAARQIDAADCTARLATFVQRAWTVLHPSEPLLWNWHLDAIADHTQATLEELARAIVDPAYEMRWQQLLMNVPPRSLKTEIVSTMAVAWAWLRWPWMSFRCTSGNPRVVLKSSDDCHDIITSEWYQGTFRPPWSLRQDIDAKGMYQNTARGFRRSASSLAAVTGEGTHVIICDDPHDAEDAESELKRTKVLDKWDRALKNRVASERACARIIIAQRLAVHDLCGWVLRPGEKPWEHLVSRQEHDPEAAVNDKPTMLAWTDPRTEPGELLHAARFGPADVEAAKLRPRIWAGQHQQSPKAKGGSIFKTVWWRWFESARSAGRARPDGASTMRAESLPRRLHALISVDANFKATTNGSRAAVTTVAYNSKARYVLRCWAKSVNFTVLVAQVKAAVEDVRDYLGEKTPVKIIIEDKANGPAVVSALEQWAKDRGVAVVPVNPEGGKESRAWATEPSVMAGQWYLGDGDPWVDEFVDELEAFPMGAHDDIVDSITQAAEYLRMSPDAARTMMLIGRG